MQPCLNGGTCSVDGVSYTCTCTSCYSGVNCENYNPSINIWYEVFQETTKDYFSVKNKCNSKKFEKGADKGYPAFFKNQQEYNNFVALGTRNQREYLGL